mmetsp:Transcript_2844/g.6801  ORF Transcript_2844/g.6801 Transcript_2844/m.6801 type:complete len:224 (-) Transcript_2844:267-938(-)
MKGRRTGTFLLLARVMWYQSATASTGGCGRKGCWRALLVLRTVINMVNHTRWRRTGRRPSTMVALRSNWPATASPQIKVSRRICLACPTRRRCTPGALILDRGRRRKSDRSSPHMWEEIEMERSRTSGRRSQPFVKRRTRVRALYRTMVLGSAACAACLASVGLSYARRSASSRAATRRTGKACLMLRLQDVFPSCSRNNSPASRPGTAGPTARRHPRRTLSF